MIQRKLQPILKRLLEWLKKSRVSHLCFPGTVQQDMQALGRDSEEYYLQKMLSLGGMFFAGLLLAAGYLIWYKWFAMSEIRVIERPEVYEETRQVTIQAGVREDAYSLDVAPRVLSREEADVQVEELILRLEDYILGANQSLNNVTENLYLPDYMEGYPFEIYWESDREHVIDETGIVNRYGLAEDEVVVLTAVFYYEEWMWETQFGVCVKKEVLSSEEQYSRDLGTFLQEQEQEQRDRSFFTLPESFKEEAVTYKQRIEDNTILLLAGLLIMAAIAGWFAQDNDLRAERNKRRAVFQEEYVSFLSSLSMYISAGMTLTSAMSLCAQSYVRRKPEGHLFRTALSEFGKDIQNGYSFAAAMERFSVKADDANYRKLSGLLNQSMINGSRGLVITLEEEVEKIREEKRRKSKVKGEQVSTALIAPMMLQLGIVIALIMIPAFTNMQF